MSKILLIFVLIFLTGCSNMGPPKPQPVRPVLTCNDCSGLAYYGPQQAPPPDPRVQMAHILTGGITKVLGIGAGVYAATEMAKTVSDAGRYVVGPTNTTETTTSSIEAVQPTVVTTDKAIPIEPVIVQPEIINAN